MMQFECLTPDALLSMQERKLYFRDLSEAQQDELLDAVLAENTDENGGPQHRLDGEATQAFLGSIHGLIMVGASRVAPRFSAGKHFLYEHDDLVHDYIAYKNPGKIATIMQETDLSIGTKIVWSVWAESRRRFDSHGHRGLRWPAAMNIARIKDVYEEALLHDVPEDEIVKRLSKFILSERYRDRQETIRRIIPHLFIDEIIVEQITPEDEWAKRLEIDHDVNDDELIGTGHDLADTHDPYATDATIGTLLDDMVAEQEMAKLQKLLYSFPKRDAAIVLEYFGFQGPDSVTYDSIGKKHDISKERVRKIIDKVLDFLRDPEEYCAKIQKATLITARYGLIKNDLNPDISSEVIKTKLSSLQTSTAFKDINELASQNDSNLYEFREQLSGVEKIIFGLQVGLYQDRPLSIDEIQEFFSFDVKSSVRQILKKAKSFRRKKL